MRLASAALSTLYPPHPHPVPVPSCQRKQRQRARALRPQPAKLLSHHTPPSPQQRGTIGWTKSSNMRKLKRSAGGPSRGNGAVSLVPAKPPIMPRVQKSTTFPFCGRATPSSYAAPKLCWANNTTSTVLRAGRGAVRSTTLTGLP
jgi:hypothetical protein